jgi:hypothetical protein
MLPEITHWVATVAQSLFAVKGRIRGPSSPKIALFRRFCANKAAVRDVKARKHSHLAGIDGLRGRTYSCKRFRKREDGANERSPATEYARGYTRGNS